MRITVCESRKSAISAQKKNPPAEYAQTGWMGIEYHIGTAISSLFVRRVPCYNLTLLAERRQTKSATSGSAGDNEIEKEVYAMEDIVTTPWIIERDTHEPDTPDIDFLTMLLENEFR